MASILDTATILMPHGTYNSTQSFPGLALYPRQLPTAAVTIHLLTPPVASAVFTLEVASTQNGVYSPVAVLTWPAGVSGSKQLALGANSSRAWLANNTCVWARLSLTTTGALTGSAWLTKASDGSFGLASRSYALDNIGAL
jgi:hypothetical protein